MRAVYEIDSMLKFNVILPILEELSENTKILLLVEDSLNDMIVEEIKKLKNKTNFSIERFLNCEVEKREIRTLNNYASCKLIGVGDKFSEGFMIKKEKREYPFKKSFFKKRIV